MTGKRLRQVRLDAGYKQAELAGLLGITQAHVSMIEREKSAPSLALLERWLAACGARLEIRTHGADGLAADEIDEIAGVLGGMDPDERKAAIAVWRGMLSVAGALFKDKSG